MDDDNERRLRGHYKSYERNPSLKVPESTLRSRRKAESAQNALKSREEVDDSSETDSENEHNRFIDSEDAISYVSDESECKKYANSNICRSRTVHTTRTSTITSKEIPMQTNDDDDSDDVQYSSESEFEIDSAYDDEEYCSSDDEADYMYNESLLSDAEDDNNYGEAEEAQFPDNLEHDVLYENSRITRKESELINLAFALRHNLPDVGLENLISTIDCHLPHEEFKSKYLFMKSFPAHDSTEFYYCQDCNEILAFNREGNGTCRFCLVNYTKKSLKKKGHFFISISLRKQLEDLVHSELYEKFRNTCQESDVINAKVYKRLKRKHIIAVNDITIQWNTDGVSLSKSSKASLWPILVTINELPYRIRKNNVLLCGLWYGENKPPMNMYLQPFIEELNILKTEGIKRCVEPLDPIVIKVHTILCTVDSVARPMVQNMKQYNGTYGCCYCLEKGERIRMGRGFARVYAYKTEAEMKIRSSYEYDRHVILATNAGKVIRGVKGPSILSQIPDFDVIHSLPPDYMHSCLLGVAKLFVTAWFDSTNKSKDYYIGTKVNQFNEKLLSLRPPSEITRTPRKITDKYKANEWKNFVLYYSIPCLQGIMNPRYIKHWHLFVLGLSLLLQENISKDDLLLAKNAFHQFVKDVRDLYGIEFMKYNVHLLLHIPKYVSLFGALWAWSTFPFEGFNGVISHLFFGTQYIPQQIMKCFGRLRYLRNTSNVFADNNTDPKVLKLFLKLMNQSRVKSCIEYGDDLRIFGKPKIINLTLNEKNVIEQAIEEPVLEKCQGYDRFIYKHVLFHSSKYKRIIKRNNSTILTTDKQFLIISSLLLVNCRNSRAEKYVIIGNKLKIINRTLCTNRNYSSSKYSYIVQKTNEVVCYEISLIDSKCINIPHELDRHYIFPIVNKFETD